MNNKLNIALLVVLVILGIYSLGSFVIYGISSFVINTILISIAINIIFNIIVGSVFNKKKLRLLKKAGFNNITLKQISGLEKVKTIIFSKQDLISQNKYELVNVEHRSTVSKKTILETAVQVAKLWKSPYLEVLEENLEELPADKNFLVTQKSKEGISVTDETGKKTLFGNYLYVQEFVKKEDGSTLYLVKNNILIGKFTFKELWNRKGVELVKKLNQFGNLVYLDTEPINKHNDSLPFDKAYVNLNIDEQKEIISKLSSKAKTALFTTDENISQIANYNFLVKELSHYQGVSNCIKISISELYNINKIFLAIKKVHNQLNYARLIILILTIAFVFYLVQNAIG